MLRGLPPRERSDVLTDRCVLITGASSGIGRACAQGFARLGARLVLCARRREGLAELAEGRDADVHAFARDVRDRSAVEAAIAGLPEAWSAVDVLVNNAGLAAGL